MYKHKHSKSSLFLMEIILNILFFAILITVCLQLFYKAHTLSNDSIALHRAVSTCQSVAEVCQSDGNVTDTIASVYPDSHISQDKIVIYFDSDFKACEKTYGIYEVTLTGNVISQKSSTGTISLNEISNEKKIYSLDFSTYCLESPNTYEGGN